MQSHSVTLGFFDSDSPTFQREKPYVCIVPLTHAPKSVKQTNIEYVDKAVDVQDIRGSEHLFNLDVHGFQLVKHDTTFCNWHDGKRVVKEYYPHIAQLLKDTTGSSSVYLFDHSVRLGDHVPTPQRTRQVQGLPSMVAHVDYSKDAVIRQIQDDFPEQSEKLLAGRFEVINIWHPIVEPVEQQPLTLCDYRTAKTDAFPADLVYPHMVSENMMVRHSQPQKWYFIDRQQIGEAWVFKMSDSRAESDPEVSKC
ncbi:hypothetical protein NM208_g8963 [Fusarium decemcellulare]|uniref:Uncharacterized protein n=1 Tax=Fusarium decemcellulare TaxID=57161 RepID=A0ACC1S3B5_9HYPO|nr:hypothetical protein NM208_g8963 [Fusarium decemcellulare]